MTADAVGGVWQYALELATGLCSRGARVLLAVFGPEPSPSQRDEARAIAGLTMAHCSHRLEWMPGADQDLDAAAAWIAELHAAFQPDVLHVNGYALASVAPDCPTVVVCHSCVRSWWLTVHGSEAPAEWDAYTARVAAGLAAADVVVAPSMAFLRSIKRIYGPQARALVIHNGRSGGFRPGLLKQPIVFSCGRVWDRAKGADLLDRLAARLPWPTFLAGSTRTADGAIAPPLRYVRTLGSLSRNELAAWLASSSIFVLPARYEPFGLAALEAAMSGCALVLGDIPTLRELWDDAALFAPLHDEGALHQATLRLIRNPLLRNEMGARALLRARRYAAATMVEGYLHAYRRATLRHDLVTDTRLPSRAAESMVVHG
jgi:glycogen synthase